MTTRVGIVGLGAMGSAMAIMLTRAGFAVVGFDLREAALKELEDNGGSRAASPRAVAEAADVVIVSLPSIEAYHRALTGQGGIGSADCDDLTVICTCTMPVDDKLRAADMLARQGKTLLDGTVSGNRDMILAKNLTAYISGDEAAYQRWSDVLSAFTRQHSFVGEFGNASKIKFVINHLVCALTCANAEAMALGLKAGLKAQLIFDMVRDSAASSRLWEIRGPMMVSEDYTSSRGQFGMAAKDGPVIGAFGQAMHFPMPVFQAALQMHQAAVGLGQYHLDTASLCRTYETIGGIKR
jgi:L-threonate 2-dehydrogenase